MERRTDRSSRLEVFCKKGVLKNFAKFSGKHLCQGLFFNKVAGLRPASLLIKKGLWHRYFFWEFWEIFTNTLFYRTPLITYRFSKTLENTYEGVQFSKAAELQPATLLNINSLIDTKQWFQSGIHKNLPHSFNLFDKCRQLFMFK